MHLAIKSLLSLYLLIALFGLKSAADIDLCGDHTDGTDSTVGVDIAALKTMSLNWTQSDTTKSPVEAVIDYYGSFCSPLKAGSDTKVPANCNGSHVCQHIRHDNQSVGYKLRRADEVSDNVTANKKGLVVQFDGPPCPEQSILNKTIKITFICDSQLGTPEHIVDTSCSTNFKWKTPAVCRKPPSPPTTTTPPPLKTVHCVWDNGSHILDLTQLAMTSGNHFAVGVPTITSSDYSIYYINICRPLNPIKEKHMSLKECGPNSAACKVSLSATHEHLNLGEPTSHPISVFDGSVSLFYENGDPCPQDPSKRLSTRIKFECDRTADLFTPTVHEPGSESLDEERCVYMFEFKTAAVCDVLQPTKLANNSCTFTDKTTGLSVDLSPLKKPSKEPYNISSETSGNVYELNVCGLTNTIGAPECYKSAVCMVNKTKSVFSYGLLTSSAFFYDGVDLRLKHYDGSKCEAHSDTGVMSSEIVFKCNPNAAKDTRPVLVSETGCTAVFTWETALVCNLVLPKCALVADDKLYNLRQLSSISHAWNATDPNDNKTVYFLNVCTALPHTVGCEDRNAAACKCTLDPARNGMNCSQSLGDLSADELTVDGNGNLVLTYVNGEATDCDHGIKTASTKILFICGTRTGSPEFKGFDRRTCSYHFEWRSWMACSLTDRNDTLSMENGFLRDDRIDSFIDLRPLLTQTFKVKEQRRLPDNTTDEYTYVINLNTSQMLDEANRCLNAAVCQTKELTTFFRDIGSLGSAKYYLRGHELQIALQSLDVRQKCGKNRNKNVTTILRLHCASSAGFGAPTFMYESNDCDYTFNWETALVCPEYFVKSDEYVVFVANKTRAADADSGVDISEVVDDSSKGKSSTSSVWIGILIVMFFVVTLTGLVLYKQRVRQAVMFKFRRMFRPETTNHTFHYHQISL